jgi:hypothetical protein
MVLMVAIQMVCLLLLPPQHFSIFVV